MKPKAKPTEQEYFCVACGFRGRVYYEKPAGVYEVRNLIARDHEERSFCKSGMEWITVFSKTGDSNAKTKRPKNRRAKTP